MIHPDRLKALTEGAEREAEQTHPFDSQVTMNDGRVIPSRSATQGARYSACRAALLKSALRAEGLVEAGKVLRDMLNDLRNKQQQMLDQWSEGSPEKQPELWRRLHQNRVEYVEAVSAFDAALHAFNTKTNNPE